MLPRLDSPTLASADRWQCEEFGAVQRVWQRDHRILTLLLNIVGGKAMSLSELGQRTLFLAGAVPVPTPFPELGAIWIDREGVVFRRLDSRHESVLCVEHVTPPSLAILRAARLRDVAAVFVPADATEDVDLDKGVWLLGPEIDKLEDVKQCNGPDQRKMGIVYLPESAPVLMRTEFGMTGGESANYYLGGHGCDPCQCCNCCSGCCGDGSCKCH